MKISGIQSKKLPGSIIDTVYKAVNYDGTNSEFNDSNELVRYEFLEILIRLANMKYVQKGNLGENANARAFKRLINEHILPIESKVLFPAWQSFRDEHIWTFEVNKLLENNL